MALTTVGVISLGCAKNRVDTERMLALLTDAGYDLTNDAQCADILIVNTCGFIESAKQESIDTILEMAAHKRGRCKVLAVTGCLSERYRAELLKELPEVDIILGVSEYDKLLPFLSERGGGGSGEARCMDARVLTTPKHMAYLRVADGCDNRCSYCAIPSIRGPYVSERAEKLVDEARTLVSGGAKELVLIAQDTTRFGQGTGESLPGLIQRLSAIDGVEWLRLMYAYPDSVTDELIETLLNNPKVVKYLDLPIQHADDAMLKRMNRRGTSSDIRDIVKKLRSNPEFVLRTSIIVGFPGETEAEFSRLLSFMDEAEFDHVGAFAYSPEDGTPAAEFSGPVGEDVKRARLERLMSRTRVISQRRKRKRVGKQYRVLVERTHERGFAGRSYAEAPETDGEILFSAHRPLEPGELVTVKLTGMSNYDFWGELI